MRRNFVVGRLPLRLLLWGSASALALATAGFASGATAGSASGSVVSRVSVSPAFFNPTLGQKQTIRLHAARAGTLAVEILDRDRIAIRTLEPLRVAAGEVTVIWDGKDQREEVVPDEAYNLRLKFTDGTKSEVYSPSEHFHPVQQAAKINFYSREDGVLSYTLPWPARVHAQAGQASKDPKTGEINGPIFKTLVDDGPRVAGSVIEKWNGLDEGRTIYVPDLPHFVVAVLATSLPPCSMITVGNRRQTFFAYAQKHRPAEALQPRKLAAAAAPHHLDLNALEDQTPTLEVKPAAAWDSGQRAWKTTAPLEVEASIVGDGAPYFLSQPTRLEVFVDEKEVRQIEGPAGKVSLELESSDLSRGAHRVVFNWSSGLGPVAVNAMRVSVEPADEHGKGSSR
jgi:FlgD Ig-like domain